MFESQIAVELVRKEYLGFVALYRAFLESTNGASRIV